MADDNHDEFFELIRRVREGSEDAAREMVAKYGLCIRQAVRRARNHNLRSKFDSLDLVQIVLRSFFRKRDRLNALETSEQLVTFLAGMVRNKVRVEERRYRTEKRQVGREVPLPDLPGGESNLPDREPSHVEMLMLLEKWDLALKGRSERDRRIVQMRAEGLTWEAIGKALEIDQNHAQRILAGLVREACGE